MDIKKFSQDAVNISNNKMPKRQNEFMNYLFAIRGRSVNTISSYNNDLQLFFKFMKYYKGIVPNDIDFDKIIINDIDDNFLRNISLNDIYTFLNFSKVYRNNVNSTRARETACLKSFFKYLNRKAKIIIDNPAEELEMPKIEKRTPVYLDINQSKLLLQSISGRNVERDFCIITTFLNCGIRLSELCGMNISDMKMDTITVIGKGNKQRVVYLNEKTLKSISDYLLIRNKKRVILDSYSEDALFLSEQNKRINKRSVQHIVEKFVAKAGLDKKYTVHKLRHTTATLLFRNGTDIMNIKEILGHDSVSTTQIYTHVDNTILKKAITSLDL